MRPDHAYICIVELSAHIERLGNGEFEELAKVHLHTVLCHIVHGTDEAAN
jgi:hypothetical protein